MRVLFVTKKKKLVCKKALSLVTAKLPNVDIATGERTDAIPKIMETWQGDYLISFLSAWIIPASILKKARIATINFHPGPPEYPGTGCTNFAIYNGEKEYGVTCHHMNKKVDTGDIIKVERFPIEDGDTVFSLTERCYEKLFALFGGILQYIFDNKPLPKSLEKWQRKPYTRKELEELCKVSYDMPEKEIKRRIKATTFPGMPGAFTNIKGFRFEYKS